MPPGHCILLVDDEEALTSPLSVIFEADGYRTLVANNGLTALDICAKNAVDLVILDVMLPGMDGMEVCAQLRDNYRLLILMLTARSDVEDRVHGLVSGADDYLAKPFDVVELRSRVRSLLRRGPALQPAVPASPAVLLRVGPYTLDEKGHEVRRDDRMISLSRREHDLFALFMLNPAITLQREYLLSTAWADKPNVAPGVLDVYIGYLRNKLDPEQRHLQTVRGAGYRLVE